MTIYNKLLIKRFRDKERWQYSILDQNNFSIALGQVDRYYTFLHDIYERYSHENEKYNQINIFPQLQDGEKIHQVTEDEAVNLDKASYYGELLQLDIESFYIFAKITIDKMASFIEQYFGIARGCSFKSHDCLLKSMDRYTFIKKIDVPKEFIDLAKELKIKISDYRDKQIEHYRNPRRLVGIANSKDGDISLFPTFFNPKESDFKVATSSSLPVLLEMISEYFNLLCKIIEGNRTKSTYEKKEEA